MFIFGFSLDRSTTPAFSSPPLPPPLAPLAFTALSRSPSPLSPRRSPALLQPHRSLRDDGDEDAVTSMRTYVFPANLKTIDARIRRCHPRPRRRANHLRPRANMDPAPPTITRTTTLFVTEVSRAWTPNTLSLLGHQICNIFVSIWIRGTCLDSSSLIDWLWIWLMDFIAPSLFE
jgi:hypothetical protein